MKEQTRVIRDYGTKVGFIDNWLCQHRFIHNNGEVSVWQTCAMFRSKKEAKAYFANEPDWVKNF